MVECSIDRPIGRSADRSIVQQRYVRRPAPISICKQATEWFLPVPTRRGTSLPFINRITSNVRHYKPKLFIIATLPRVLLLAFPRCISGTCSVTIINHFVPAWFIKASRWYSRTTTPTRKQLSQQEQDGGYSYQSHQRCGDIDDTNPAIFRPRPWPRGAAALSGAIAAAAATHERRLECCNNATGAVTEKFWR